MARNYRKYISSWPRKYDCVNRIRMSLKKQMIPSSRNFFQNVETIALINDGLVSLFFRAAQLLQFCSKRSIIVALPKKKIY